MQVIGLFLLLAACVGHTALLTYSMNWWYAMPLRERALKSIRLLHALAVAAGPVLFGLPYGLDYARIVDQPLDGTALGTAYLIACWVIGLVALPGITVYRWLRKRPVVVLSNHTQTIDVAKRLGYVPAGDGKYRRLVHLPGNQVFQVDLADRTLRVPGLPPAWDGLTILHLSDLHFCGTPDRKFFQEVIDLAGRDVPDLVAITGDFVDSDVHHRWIIPVLGRLRWNVAAFAVLGNHDGRHDHVQVRRRLRRLGIRVLGNGWERIEVRSESMVVIGNEYPWFGPEPDLTSCPEGFRFCLSHTPDNIPWARRHGVNLMVAGHNHGGQIRFPVIGPIFMPSRFSRHYDLGTFHEPPTIMHVSRGLSGKQPLRYNCRPEVTRLILRGG